MIRRLEVCLRWPSLILAATQYNRVLRLLERSTEVQLELDVAASFHDEDLVAVNALAEIPGDPSSSAGKGDLMQASVIMAAFVWNAANREALLPRKPLPRDP
jgi:hypothetical protein